MNNLVLKGSVLIVTLTLFFSSYGVTFTTTQSGKFGDRNIWTPDLPPVSLKAGDTIIVKHAIEMQQSLTVAGVLIIEPFASVSYPPSQGIAIGPNGTLENNGSINTGTLLVKGTLINQKEADINVSREVVATDQSLVSNKGGTFFCGDGIQVSGRLENSQNGTIEAGSLKVFPSGMVHNVDYESLLYLNGYIYLEGKLQYKELLNTAPAKKDQMTSAQPSAITAHGLKMGPEATITNEATGTVLKKMPILSMNENPQ